MWTLRDDKSDYIYNFQKLKDIGIDGGNNRL